MIKVIAIGKTRQAFVRDGVDEFLKRLGKYVKIEYKEVEKIPPTAGYLIALDEHGKEFTSQDFAKKVAQWTMAHKDIIFIIGPAEGLPAEVLEKCNEKISLSTMTFPNQLVRVIFLEQLYRAFTIIKCEPYHKE